VEEPEKKRKNRFWPNVDGRIFDKNLVPRTNREEMVRTKSEAVGDNCCAAVRGPATRPLSVCRSVPEWVPSAPNSVFGALGIKSKLAVLFAIRA
jgi:hypothetical protein